MVNQDERAVELTPESVDRYIQGARGAGSADASNNRGTQLLRQAFRLAVERQRLSSAPKIRHLSEKDNVRQGFFEQADFEAVVSFLPLYLRDFARFSYCSGWRKGEISSLAWEDVDVDHKVGRLRAQ